MVMTYIFTGFLALSILAAAITGNGGALAAAIPEGAQAGITLAISIAGSMCLWTGAGKLMEQIGLTAMLGKLLSPVLGRLFPSTKHDTKLRSSLSANICANILGLGNAATPMGIMTAKRMVKPDNPGIATDELCRLIVLNTASIQLLPTTIASLRAAYGSSTPFDILPAVWLSSVLSVCAGLFTAHLLSHRKGGHL